MEEEIKNEKEDIKNKFKYRVEMVEKTTPPEGLTGDNWYRYVVGQGTSKVEGKKPGTLKGVTQHAEIFASELNLRRGGGSSAYAPRKKT
ncbi:MAG: hypothetical protein ACC635_03535 [Acidiferrobacterales bacterium]